MVPPTHDERCSLGVRNSDLLLVEKSAHPPVTAATPCKEKKPPPDLQACNTQMVTAYRNAPTSWRADRDCGDGRGGPCSGLMVLFGD